MFASLVINNSAVKFKLDCAATVNMISGDIYQLNQDPQHKLLEHTACYFQHVSDVTNIGKALEIDLAIVLKLKA